MKVQLVLPGEEGYRALPEGWWMPLGLLSLGTYIRRAAPYANVEILDGRHTPNNEIAGSLDGDIVGFGPSITSYRPAIRMAEEVKARSPDSFIVFGGPYVTPMPMTVLMKRPFIDAVVSQDGEEALEGLVRSNGVARDVSNLTYHGGLGSEEKQKRLRELGIIPMVGPITKTSRRLVRVRDAPFPDMSLLEDLEKYWQDFWSVYPEFEGERIITTAAQRGCPYRSGEREGCFFCSRVDRNYRVTNPLAYARYVKQLEDEFSVSIIEESSDDFAANRNWLRRFAEAYEDLGLAVRYRIFGRADTVLRSIEDLKRINTQSVFIGYESGDEEMLEVCNKGLSLDTALEATQVLNGEGIDIVGAFVLGFPGESKASIQNTIEFARKVTDMGATTISYSVLTPLPPSPAWRMMMENRLRVYATRLRLGIESGTEYGNTDLLDPVELQRDFVNTFCEVDYDYVTAKLAEFASLGDAQTGDFIPG